MRRVAGLVATLAIAACSHAPPAQAPSGASAQRDAERAAIDAQVAQSRAAAEQARRAARQVDASVASLRERMKSGSP